MGAQRINVTLPEDVVQALKDNAGSREISSFIAKSVRFYVKQLKRKRLQNELREGYQATSQEAKAISAEFDATLTDGLDEN